MQISYVIERSNGVMLRADGIDGWERILSHEDTTLPGRVHWFMVEINQRPAVVQLNSEDVLVFAWRRRLLDNSPVQNTDRVIIGLTHKDGTGFYMSVSEHGVMATADFLAC